MPHIFVETNWIVDCTAPAYNKVPAALDLLRRAMAGEIHLYLPAICLAEAKHPLFTKFQTRQSADRVRQFVTWAISAHRLTADQGTTIRQGIDLMENVVKADLQNMETTLRELAQSPGVEVFPMTAAMLERSIELCFDLPELKPWDQAVLAAVLVRASSTRTFNLGTRTVMLNRSLRSCMIGRMYGFTAIS